MVVLIPGLPVGLGLLLLGVVMLGVGRLLATD